MVALSLTVHLSSWLCLYMSLPPPSPFYDPALALLLAAQPQGVQIALPSYDSLELQVLCACYCMRPMPHSCCQCAFFLLSTSPPLKLCYTGCRQIAQPAVYTSISEKDTVHPIRVANCTILKPSSIRVNIKTLTVHSWSIVRHSP